MHRKSRHLKSGYKIDLVSLVNLKALCKGLFFMQNKTAMINNAVKNFCIVSKY